MANNEIQIPGLNFEELAQAAIAAKIGEALIGAKDILPKVVGAALMQKVNYQGQVGTYDSKTPWIEWQVHQLIHKATIAVLATKLDELQPALEKEIEKSLRADLKGIAQALSQSFVDRAKDKYGISATLQIKVEGRER